MFCPENVICADMMSKTSHLKVALEQIPLWSQMRFCYLSFPERPSYMSLINAAPGVP